MSKILKRPMFRKGGFTNEGIVSMAAPRKNYANGKSLGDIDVETGEVYGMGPTGYPIFQENIQYTPSNPRDDNQVEDRILRDAQRYANIAQKVVGSGASYDPAARFLIDFGQSYASARPMGRGVTGALSTAAAAAKEPTKVLYEGLDKRDAARKQLALFGLQQAFKGDESKATAAITNSKIWAKGNYEKFKGDTPEQKMENAFNYKLDDILKKEKAVTSMEEKIRLKADELRKNEKVKMNEYKAAETAVKYPDKFVSYISVTSRGVSDIIPQGDGSIAVLNKNKPGITDTSYEPNLNYIDPLSGSIYQYQGKGTFRRVIP